MSAPRTVEHPARRPSLVDRLVPPGRVRPLGVVAVVCATVDSVATWAWLRFGIATEGNPAVDRVITEIGLTAGLAARTAYAAVCIGLLVLIAERRPTPSLRAFIGIVATAMIGIATYHAGFAVLYVVLLTTGTV